MKHFFSRAPLLPVLACFVAGIFLFLMMPSDIGGSVVAWITAAVILLSVGLFILIPDAVPASVMVVAFVAGTGCSFMAVPVQPPVCDCDGLDHRISAVVLDEVVTSLSQRTTVRVFSVDSSRVEPFRMQLTIGDIAPACEAGDTIVCLSSIWPVNEMNAPEGLAPGKFWFYSRGISASGYTAPYGLHMRGRSDSLRFLPQRLRRLLAEAVYAVPFSHEVQGLILSTVLGLRGETPPEMNERFTALGLAHLLCVSGYHVGLVAALVSLIMMPLPFRMRHGRTAVSLLLIWLYVIFCGTQPAAVRAGIMLSVFLAVRAAGLPLYSWNNLALAAIIILAFNPFRIFDGGFLLSFCAVAGIMMFAYALNPLSHRDHHGLRTALNVLLVPLGATIGTLPAVLYIFHSFPLYFLPANMLAALLFPIFLILSGGAVALWHMGLRYAWICGPADKFTEFVSGLLSAGDTDLLRLSDIYPSGLAIFLLAAGIISSAIMIRVNSRRWRMIAALTSLVCIAACFLLPSPLADRHELWIGRTSGGTGLTVCRRAEMSFLPLDSVDFVADPVISHPRSKTLAVGAHIYDFGSERMEEGDIIVVHRGFRPSPDSLMRCKPERIIICPDISDIRRRKYRNYADSIGVPCLILGGNRFLNIFEDR